ncbi:response regulator [Pedobacter frigiditerrae]|uniref:Response regulator n=1 Tax=Pedobacter frigiditerrae TaxID=2530452 RepID=A0A4R0MV94_9SPHI|nr:response regulator [Pedobacter frigiditerrae]TCC90122.1 response regulator [Pedobacter frigiditerrae]
MDNQSNPLSLIPLSQTPASSHAANTKTILLVEDDFELSSLLKQLFEKEYVIYEAKDADSAMSIALEKNPDLIISDTLMPEMNGVDFCKLIKQTFATSHIPFILLSGKDTLDSKLEGLRAGTDFHFAKPLSAELLTLTIKNIFLQQQKLKERYTDHYLADHTELVCSEKGNIFVNKLLEIIEKHIDSEDLGVEFLCNHLFISRTKLYQKIKSFTNQSVGEFVRTVRLKKAIHIMTHEDVTISEVAERIGLPNVSNFSRFFKKAQGKSPLQFIQSLKKQTPTKTWSYLIMNSYFLNFCILLE